MKKHCGILTHTLRGCSLAAGCILIGCILLGCHPRVIKDDEKKGPLAATKVIETRTETEAAATLIRFEVRQMPAMRIVGKAVRIGKSMPSNPIPSLWKQCVDEKILETLLKSQLLLSTDYVGWMGEWNPKSAEGTYLAGMMLEEDAPVPAGYDYVDLPTTLVAIGWVQGPEYVILSQAHTLVELALKESGYTLTPDDWSMEVYNSPRFTEPMENGNRILDYYIACEKP